MMKVELDKYSKKNIEELFNDIFSKNATKEELELFVKLLNNLEKEELEALYYSYNLDGSDQISMFSFIDNKEEKLKDLFNRIRDLWIQCCTDNNLIISDGVLTKCSCDNKTIVLPSGITKIASRAFENCKNLESIQFNKELKEIRELAFLNCTSLKELNLNEGLETIYDCAFQNCSSLEMVMLPSSIKQFVLFDNIFSIFDGCYNIKKIVINEHNSFYSSCDSNVIFDKKTATLLFGCATSKIPLSTKAIGSRCFFKQTNLKEIELPNGLETIKSEAFYGCYQLKRLFVPKSLTKIDASAFIGTELAIIESDIDNPSFKSIDNVLIAKESNTVVLAAKNSSIPSDVKIIGEYSYAGSKLKKIIIPSNVKLIEAAAFLNSDMEELVVSEGVLEMMSSAFSGCHNLKTVYLSHSLIKNIDFEMDFGIAKNAFFDCPSLKIIIFNGSEEEWLRLSSERKLSFKNVEIRYK